MRETAGVTGRLFGYALATSIGLLLFSFLALAVLAAAARNLKDDLGVAKTKEATVYRDYGGSQAIAYLELAGIIEDQESPADPLGSIEGVITPRLVEKALQQIEKDKKFKAVLVYVSSPGGSPVGSDRIWETISAFRGRTRLPVVAVLGDVAASGGYYIASAAEKIVAQPSTVTGSIGVILDTYNLAGLYEKVGIEKQVFKAGKYKDILDESRGVTAEEKVMIQKIMTSAYQTFLDRVATGRNLSVAKVELAADGKIYSALEAKEMGLVDEVGSFDQAAVLVAKMAGLDKFRLIPVETEVWWETILGQIGGKMRGLGLYLGWIPRSTGQFRILYKLP